jgi:hypothetical protein
MTVVRQQVLERASRSQPLFAGRQALLESMKDYLITDRGKKDLSVFVLKGYGGAGKSEVAIKFATDFQNKFVLSGSS